MSANSARIGVPVVTFWRAIVAFLAYLRRTRSNDQTIKASNPAKKKPPSSIDQSPVSNPRSRPSAVKRSAAERNIVEAFMPFDRLLYKHAQCLLAVAGQQHRATTVINMQSHLPVISIT
jgi:hypothetical protein